MKKGEKKRFCNNGHDKTIVGTLNDGKHCQACYDEKRTGRKPRPKVQFCPKGHDTFVVGRDSTGMCRECSRGRSRKWNREHSEEKKKEYKDNIDEIKKQQKQYREEHKEEIKIKHQGYYLNNKPAFKEKLLKQNFNITLQDYNKLLEKQNGLCAGCEIPQIEVKKAFAVDHDHNCCPGRKSCGKCIRGLLCDVCNRGMGLLKDNPKLLRRLADYLDKYKVKEK